MSFVVYRVESRRLKTPTSIPWAEQAPAVAVPYPSYLEKIAIRRDPLKRNVLDVELNVFPSAPVDSSTFLPAWFNQKENRSNFDTRRLDPTQLDEYPVFVDSSTFLPAWLSKAANQVEFDINKQETPELNEYPVTPVDASAFMPAWLLKPANQSSFDITRQEDPELNEYPFDPAFLSGFYPGSALAKANKVWFRRKHQEVQEFNLWPATPPTPEQPLTAFLLKKANILEPQIRILQLIEPLFVESIVPPVIIRHCLVNGLSIFAVARGPVQIKPVASGDVEIC